jgi:hypothetical protein
MIESSEDKLVRHLTRISYDEMCEAIVGRIRQNLNPNYAPSKDPFTRYEYYGWTQEEVNEEVKRRKIHYD